ncbi:MAG: hypothetical protein KBT69_11230 [Oceanihabitans sp.]|nr:hypothetical protein [Oceanihabitans sp.]
MQVINIHKRKLQESVEKVALLFDTLGTDEDQIWPVANWPAMRFRKGVQVGSKGGHGFIRYTIIALTVGERITFQFTKPDNFIGTHSFFIKAISENETEITHEIKMRTASLKASVLWLFVIRWLHDALLEEAFDNLENRFMEVKKIPKYSFWVHFLRNTFKRKPVQTKQN